MNSEPAWLCEPESLLAFVPGTPLNEISPDKTVGFEGSRAEGIALTEHEAEVLERTQEQLFAGGRHGGGSSVLLILQGMDTAGKGNVIRHVVSHMHPGGVRHSSFTAPTPEELAHDFLWRVRKRLPQRGEVGVFDRSHYEDVLIGRVRPRVSFDEIESRYDTINAFEAEVVARGTSLVKVMLHVSKDEQKRRLASRLERVDKQWKFDPSDIDDRLLWDRYQHAYQIALDRTSVPSAPWYVVPADNKWFARLAVQHLLIRALERLDISWPPPNYDINEQKARLAAS